MVWVKICGITNEEDAKNISNLGVDALGFILSTDSPRRVDVDKAKKIIQTLEGEDVSTEEAKGRDKDSKDEHESGDSCRDNGGKNIKDSYEGVNYSNNKVKYRLIKNRISVAGVFVNEEVNKVLDITKKLGLDYIQLSGDEDIEYIGKIKEYIKYIDSGFANNTNDVGGNENIKLIKSIRIKNNIGSTEDVYKKIQSLKELVDYFLMDTFKEDMYGGTGKSFRWDIIKNWGLKFPIILSGGLSAENVKEAINLVRPYGVDASSKLEAYPGKKDLRKVERFVKVCKNKLNIN